MIDVGMDQAEAHISDSTNVRFLWLMPLQLLRILDQ